jgi:K+-transporting ATPase ATPase C chain
MNMSTASHPPRTSFFSHLRSAVALTIVLTLIVSGAYPLVVYGIAQVFFPDQANGSLLLKDGKVIGSTLIGQNFSDPKYFHPRPSAAGNGYDPTNSGGSNLGPTSAKFLNGTTKVPAPPTPAAPAAGATTASPASTVAAPVAAATPTPVVDNDGIQLRVLHYCDDNGLPYVATWKGKEVDISSYKSSEGWDEVKLIGIFNDSDNPLTIRSTKLIPADAVTASASGLDPHISLANALLQVPRVAKARSISEDNVRALIAPAIDGTGSAFGEQGVNVLKLNAALDGIH